MGRLNYNCESSQFKNNKIFYDIQARIVEDFCKRKGIKYHIKYGTKIIDNKSTVKIFKQNAPLVSFQIPKQQRLLVEV